MGLRSGWDWLPPGLGTMGWIGLTATGVLAVVPWLTRLGRRMDIFEPVLFISALFLVIFFLRPIQILYDPDASTNFMPDDPKLFQEVVLLGTLGLFCFYAGYGSRMGAVVSRKLPVFRRRWQDDRTMRVTVIYTLVGIAGYSIGAARSGGFGLFLSTLRGRKLLGETGSWSIASLLLLVGVAMVIVGTQYFATRRHKGWFAISVVLALTSGLLLGSRSQVLVPLLTLLVILYYVRRPKLGRVSPRVMIVIGVCVAIGLVFALGQVTTRMHLARGGDFSDLSAVGLFVENIGRRLMDEFQQFDWFVITLDLTSSSELPIQRGKTFLEFFTRFVPRAIWPAKPQPISFRITTMVGGASAGHPSTILGELYLNFKVPGVIVGMAVFGVLLRAMYAYLQSNRENAAAILLYAYTFASLHRFFTRTFAPKMFGYVLFVVPTLLALRLIQEPKERHGTKKESNTMRGCGATRELDAEVAKA